MPVPTLPFDVVSAIISHLKEELQNDSAEEVQQGRMLSLVCRSWRSLGQGLCWRKVEIKLLRLPSLLGHFARFPHLTKLVRHCTLSGPNMDSSDITDISDKEALALLPQFLSTWVNLESLVIQGTMEEDLVPILEAASYLENLDTLGLNEMGEFNCSNEFIASLQSGFKKLSTFGVMVANSVRSSLQVAQQLANFPKLRIDDLVVAWHVEPAGASRIARDFLSIVHPTSLKMVDLHHHAACRSIVEYLSGYPNLHRLTFKLYSEENLDNLAQILSILTRFSSLKMVEIILNEQDAIGSPLSLSEIILHFPPSLRIFFTEQIVFPDLLQIPSRQAELRQILKNSRSGWALYPSDMMVDDSTRIVLMGEEKEGKVNWFRNEQGAFEME
ncbi:hypothetical protein JCM5350_007314 [Sporobolomyces pararoseus]